LRKKRTTVTTHGGRLKGKKKGEGCQKKQVIGGESKTGEKRAKGYCQSGGRQAGQVGALSGKGKVRERKKSRD